jgi:hypothetical protein
MVSILALAVIVGPSSITQTPEWVAYQKVLAKAKSYGVTMVYSGTSAGEMDRSGYGKSSMAAVRKDGTLILEESGRALKWDGKRGISLNRTTKTWKPISELKSESIILGLGLPKYGYVQRHSMLYRLTRTCVTEPAKGRTEVGWEMVEVGRDYTFRATMWFDPKTHLISGYSRTAWGMVSDGGGDISVWIAWELNPKEVDWSLKPPADYTRESGF